MPRCGGCTTCFGLPMLVIDMVLLLGVLLVDRLINVLALLSTLEYPQRRCSDTVGAYGSSRQPTMEQLQGVVCRLVACCVGRRLSVFSLEVLGGRFSANEFKMRTEMSGTERTTDSSNFESRRRWSWSSSELAVHRTRLEFLVPGFASQHDEKDGSIVSGEESQEGAASNVPGRHLPMGGAEAH